MNHSNETSESDNDCEVFDTRPYVIVALVSAGTGFISVLACLAVIGLILLYRKFYFFTQRLILYLSIAALLNSLSIVLRLQRIAYKTDNDVTKGVCIFTGFFDHVTAWSELVAICCITFNLLFNAVLHKQTEKLEKLYIALIFVFPLTFNWIPFIHLTYGKAGAWCWIRGEDDDCKRFVFGIYLRFILWYVPAYVIILILIIVYIFIIYKVHRQRHHWEGKYDPETDRQKEHMQKEVRPLLWYPLIFLVLNIFPLINRIYDSFPDKDPELTLWYLQAIFSPLQGGFIAVAYTFDKETFRRLNCVNFRAAIWTRSNTVTEYPAQQGHTDSYNHDGTTSTTRKHTHNRTTNTCTADL